MLYSYKFRTDMCLTSKWGRISQGIQWTGFQTRDLCISRVQPVLVWFGIVLNFCEFPTLVLDDLQTSALHENGVKFNQEFKGHGLRHVTHVIHVSDTFFPFRYRRVF